MSAMSELDAASAVWDAMESRPEWLGFGYLGERRNAREAVASGEWQPEILTRMAEVDAALLDVLGEGERAFTWANSREGRKFADWGLFGGWCDELPAGVAPGPTETLAGAQIGTSEPARQDYNRPHRLTQEDEHR